MPWVRRLLVVLSLAVGAAAITYFVAFAFVIKAGREDQRRPADAIAVLGAAQYDGRPSPVLQARLDHALHLYREGLAPRIIVTGGIGVGDTASEAAVGERYLESRNVPRKALVVRPEGRSTEESMAAIASYFQAESLRTVILVSDPFHMGRLRMEARHFHLVAFTSPTRTSPISRSLRGELPYVAAEAWKVPVAAFRSW